MYICVSACKSTDFLTGLRFPGVLSTRACMSASSIRHRVSSRFRARGAACRPGGESILFNDRPNPESCPSSRGSFFTRKQHRLPNHELTQLTVHRLSCIPEPDWLCCTSRLSRKVSSEAGAFTPGTLFELSGITHISATFPTFRSLVSQCPASTCAYLGGVLIMQMQS